MENEPVKEGGISIKSEDDKNGLQDGAKSITFTGHSEIRLENENWKDLRGFENSKGVLVFDFKTSDLPKDISLQVSCGKDCAGEINFEKYVNKSKLESGKWHTIQIPLSCFSDADFSKVTAAFLLQRGEPGGGTALAREAAASV